MRYNNLMELIDDFKVESVWPNVAWTVVHKGKILGVFSLESDARRMADQLKVGTRDG